LAISVKARYFFKTDLFGRLVRGIGANAYSQLVTLFIQLASVPLLISYWGVEHYGIWIALSALPAYLASSNLGIANAAASEMTILNAKNVTSDNVEVTNVYHTACVLTLIMSFVVFALALAVVYSYPPENFMFGDIMPVTLLKSTLLILILYTLVTLYGGLWDAAFRSTGRYAQGTMFLHSIRLLEQVALLLSVVFFNTDIFYAATVILICRILGTLFVALYLAISKPKIPFGLKQANLKTLRRLLPASVGFMAMPIGYAFFIQGMIIVVASFSATFVAVFATTRTLTSLGRQLVSMVAHASWPELSRAYGEGDKKLVKKLFLGSITLTSLLLFLYFLFLGFLGQNIFEIWTNGEIDFDYSIFIILSLAAIAGSIWNQCYILLASINKHAKFALAFVFIGFSLLATCYLMKGFGFDVIYILAALPIAEMLLVGIAIYYVSKLTLRLKNES
jgi:O-antigen/teichoic acid export membrane protein